MSLIYSLDSEFVVKPIAWGPCASDPDTYFFISEFRNMSEAPPDVKSFCAKIANLHLKSAAMFEQRSCNPPPEGRYGFHMPTHLGWRPQDNRWCNSWEDFYIQGIRSVLALEEEVHGPSAVISMLSHQLIEKVIPRLLRPLETGGRTIRPTLLHGDLHARNVRMEYGTNQPIIFDAGSFWAHNECKCVLLSSASHQSRARSIGLHW